MLLDHREDKTVESTTTEGVCRESIKQICRRYGGIDEESRVWVYSVTLLKPVPKKWYSNYRPSPS